MIKPSSIARFEQFYWGSVILGLINTALTWSQRVEMQSGNPVLARMPWFLPLMSVIGLIIAVVLWYFVVRKPSVVAKWIVVVFAAFGTLGVLISLLALVRGGAGQTVPLIVGIVANALYIAAAVMLFKPDAKAWFGEGLDDDSVDRDGAPLV